jgi:hypothetical protein
MVQYRDPENLADDVAKQLESAYDAAAVLVISKSGDVRPFSVTAKTETGEEDVKLSQVDFADIQVAFSPSPQSTSESYCCTWVKIGGTWYRICWC